MKNSAIKIAVALVAFGALLAGVSSPASAASSKTTSAKGPSGQTLTASISKGTLPLGQSSTVSISGRGYNTKVGIYVTFCVIPPKGQKPELCGPFDITGQNNQSVWISSNPPLYGAALVKPFGKGGTFKVTMPIDSKIGDLDCTVLKCAIFTRADHTNSDYRKADVAIPVTFK